MPSFTGSDTACPLGHDTRATHTLVRYGDELVHLHVRRTYNPVKRTDIAVFARYDPTLEEYLLSEFDLRSHPGDIHLAWNGPYG